MKSLFAKILLWFWSTLAITVVGSAFISALSVNQDDDEGSPVARLVTLQLEEARNAYFLLIAAGERPDGLLRATGFDFEGVDEPFGLLSLRDQIEPSPTRTRFESRDGDVVCDGLIEC